MNSASTPLVKSKPLTDALIHDFEDGQQKPGDQLLTKHGIFKRLDVSRAIVRKAVSALKADGVLISRQGLGVFISKNIRQRLIKFRQVDLSNMQDVRSIMEVRLALEVEAVGLPAERCSDESETGSHAELDALVKALHVIQAVKLTPIY